MAERFETDYRGRAERIGFKIEGHREGYISIEQNYYLDSPAALNENRVDRYYVKLSDGVESGALFTGEQMEEFIMAYQILKEGYKNGKNL